MKLKLLTLFAFAGVVAYSAGIDVNAATRKTVPIKFVEMYGVDKTRWIISVELPECGNGTPESNYKLDLYRAGEDFRIICKEK